MSLEIHLVNHSHFNGCLDETACNYCSICTIDDNSCCT